MALSLKTKKQTLTLTTIASEWGKCTKCEIGKHCKNHVFIDFIPDTIKAIAIYGKPRADIVFIGEAPGISEDVNSVPFVGPAGQLLRETITKADPGCTYCDGSGVADGDLTDGCFACHGHGTARIALINLLLCRPYVGKPHNAKNREPTYEEVKNCLPRLVSTLEVLNPSLVIMLGKEPESYIPAIREDLESKGIELYYQKLEHPSFIVRRGGLESNKSYVEKLSNIFEWYWRRVGKDYEYSEGEEGY